MRTKWALGVLMTLILSGCAAKDEVQLGDESELTASSSQDAATMIDIVRKNRHRVVLLSSADSSSDWGKHWVTGAIASGEQSAFVLYPTSDLVAPNGSFAVIIPREDRETSALAVYVPDEADSAKGQANRLLAQLKIDAAKLPPSTSIRTQAMNLATVENLIARFVTAGKRVATVAAEASELRFIQRVAAGALWEDFRRTFADVKAAEPFLEKLFMIRKQLGNRRILHVELGESRCGPGLDFAACGEAMQQFEKMFADLSRSRNSSGVALTINQYSEHAVPLVWALENDVPVIISAGSDKAITGSQIITLVEENLANSRTQGAESIYQRLQRVKGKVELITIINTQIESNADWLNTDFTLRMFAPIWALADEALVFSWKGVTTYEKRLLNAFESRTILAE